MLHIKLRYKWAVAYVGYVTKLQKWYERGLLPWISDQKSENANFAVETL